MLRAIRGATTVEHNTAEAIEQAVSDLLREMVRLNPVTPHSICLVFFTVTADLTAVSPAKAARTAMPWQHVPLMCAVEPAIEGLPGRCVRVLIQFQTDQPQEALVPVYLNEAVVLRPDLVSG